MARVPGSFQRATGPGAAAPVCRTFPEAAAQTFVAGDLVIRSAGKVAIHAGGTNVPILGIARQNASGVTSARVLVELIDGQAEYQANFRAADTFVEGTDNVVRYGTVKTGAGNWEVDKSEVTTLQVVVLDTEEKTPDGRVAAAAGGPIRVHFLNAVPEIGN